MESMNVNKSRGINDRAIRGDERECSSRVDGESSLTRGEGYLIFSTEIVIFPQ